MLRQIDRFLAPLTWVAAGLTVLALVAGPALIGAKNDKTSASAASARTSRYAAAPVVSQPTLLTAITIARRRPRTSVGSVRPRFSTKRALRRRKNAGRAATATASETAAMAMAASGGQERPAANAPTQTNAPAQSAARFS